VDAIAAAAGGIMTGIVGTRIRAAEPEDRPALEPFLARWDSLRVARRGELVHPIDHAMLIAEKNGRLVGLLTYVVEGAACEVLTLHVDDRRRGLGSMLIAEVEKIARRAGCTRLWVITTNDNVDALRFYQRRGFRLAVLRAGAVDASRTRFKPEIPAVGAHGIPIRDELELEFELR
jgi:ribosomal protein S18 acetylase RimI-like enzyme